MLATLEANATKFRLHQLFRWIRLWVEWKSGHAYDVDGLAALSGLENVRLLSRLIDLELQGRVRRVGGGRFMRC